MDNSQNLQDIIITVDDFIKSERHYTISNSDEGYSSYWQKLSHSADIALKNGDKNVWKVLSLLANICSFMLVPNNRHEPFKPILILNNRRSAAVEDFSNSDLDFFEIILPHIKDYRLKARIADVLWTIKKPRNSVFALLAIEAYRSFPLDADKFFKESEEAWLRAVKLCLMLGLGAEKQARQISDEIFEVLRKTSSGEKFYALRLADILKNILSENKKQVELIVLLEKYIAEAKNAEDWYCARMYAEEVVYWYRKKGEMSQCYKLYAEVAELFILEAEKQSSNLGIGSFYDNAIKSYRRIPKAERIHFRADEKIEAIRRKMNEVNKLALDEMSLISTPEIDISSSINKSRKHIQGRNFPEALRALAGISSTIDVARLKQDALDSMKQYPLRHLLGATHFESDGRIIKRSRGFDIECSDSPETNSAIWCEMVFQYKIHIDLIAQASILPAVQSFNLEHRITEKILLDMCCKSNIIPSGRELFWAKGLFCGFEFDYLAATHILIPQIEHLVRIAMKKKEIKTTVLDADNIETENGLSTLLDNQRIGEAVDENIVFEFKALLTDPSGPNLRNNIAHGLAETGDMMSLSAVYVWWFCFRLLMSSIQIRTTC